MPDSIEALPATVEPVRMARIWYDELARDPRPEAKARRAHIGALLNVINERNKTIRRLNFRAQNAESALTTVTHAVGDWEIDEDQTYVPLGSLRKIARAVGVEIKNRRWEMHYHRMRRLQKRLDRFEENMPSGQDGAPEDFDAWLRDLIPEDRRLAFYQWVGSKAAIEALAVAWQMVGDDPVPAEYRSYDASAVHEFLDAAEEGGPYPTKLPLGRPFCDNPQHVHTHGGDRLASCRLDSPEQT